MDEFVLSNTPCERCVNYTQFDVPKMVKLTGIAHEVFVSGVCLMESKLELVTNPGGSCFCTCKHYAERKNPTTAKAVPLP